MLACWDWFFSSLSRLANNCSTLNTATNISALTSASKLLSLMAVRGGKATMIEGGSETSLTTAVSLPQVDFELPAVAKNENDTTQAFTAARRRSWRKRRQAKGNLVGQPECCDRGVCCSFMMCEKMILFALHLFQRKCVCAPHCLDRLFPLTQNEIFVGQCSGPTLCFC